MENRVKPSKCVLTFDVEDWFCVRNMREVIPRETWGAQELRVQEGLSFILEQLRLRNIRATFFVLGWIADQCPELIRDIAAQGHEIASHGYSHQLLDTLSPEAFREDTEHSLRVLAPLAGKPIRGYRAPSFSVTKKTFWALDILKESGLEYDSSVYPTRHPDYGIPDFGTAPKKLSGLWEVPMTSLNLGGMLLPVSGGGYFRLFPYAMTRKLLKRASKNGPVILYFHPWEFDEGQPKVDLPRWRRFRHYVGLSKNRAKFLRLINDFEFTTVEDYLKSGPLEQPLPQ